MPLGQWMLLNFFCQFACPNVIIALLTDREVRRWRPAHLPYDVIIDSGLEHGRKKKSGGTCSCEHLHCLMRLICNSICWPTA